MIRSFPIILLFLLITNLTFSQEKMYPLQYNATVIKKFNSSIVDAGKRDSDTSYVRLPFFDDFSDLSVWPSSARWIDNFAYINTDYGKYSPTIGVATLDAIDATGALYSVAGPYQFEADYLTSQPIRLDSVFTPVQRAIFKSDSVYLSFYYQPQGRGSMPAKKDSLVLEFHSPIQFDTIPGVSDTTISPHWNYIWSSAGGVQVDTFALQNGHYFRQVLIPVTDSAIYFKKGFQFRFRNYASLANNYVPDWQSNGDQWNIDAVLLNTGRSYHDTIIKDVAFADRAPSMLKRYEAMPYAQYGENFVEEMKDTISIQIANLDNLPQNIAYKYTVQRDSQAPFETYDGGSYSIFPFLSSGYSTYQPFARPPVNFLYSPFEQYDLVVFHTKHFLITDPAMILPENDTIRYAQVFSNYYAYDDGTAEAGIGLNGASGAYAVRFDLNKADTLRGIQVYFNQVLSGSEEQYIDLTIWNDSYGKPGAIIRQMTDVTPIYADSLNQFQTYWFDSPLVMDAATFPGLIFYAGWQQNSIDNLNVGLDRYNDTHEYRFYNIDGTWQMSDELHAGSVMLRPIVGKVNPVSVKKPETSGGLVIYPNPVQAAGKVRIDLPVYWERLPNNYFLVSLFDNQGRQIHSGPFTADLSLENYPAGFYILRVNNTTTGETATGKLIIQ